MRVFGKEPNVGSAREMRHLKSALRKISKDTLATPAQKLRACEWLLYIETQTHAPRSQILSKTTPIDAEDVDSSSPVVTGPETLKEEPGVDEQLEALLKNVT